MSVYTGQFGVLKVADATGTLQSVAELRSFSIETTTETIENTTMGDNSRNYFAGLKSFSGTADIFYDNDQLEAGASDIPAFLGGTGQGGSAPRQDHVAFEAYPNGTTTGEPKINGAIIITGYSITSSLDGMVEASISFTGTGDLTMNGSAS
jgi:predicted secreted protein